jgi:L-fuculose-phosphate aldolase
MLRLGLVSGTSGNVSARDGGNVLITPSALPYEAMEVEDLVTLSLSGAVHTHSERATAWSHRAEPLGHVLTARPAPSGSDEIAVAAVEALGDREAVLLGRHGVLALGASPRAALEVAVAVEERAREASRLSD